MHPVIFARRGLVIPVLGVVRIVGVELVIRLDTDRWNRVTGRSEEWYDLFMRLPEFRTVVYLRLRNAGRWGALAAKALGALYRPQVALEIHCPDVGPGIYVEHGFATIVVAERIGVNFWVNQQVTVGYGSSRSSRRIPVIGDDVYVRSGAKVFGGIHIGDRARIGANAVVFSDVQPDATVVTPRATEIRKQLV